MDALQKNELATEIIKAAPPLTVIGTSVSGAISWSDIAYAMTALWMLVQTVWFVGRKIYRWRKGLPIDTRHDE